MSAQVPIVEQAFREHARRPRAKSGTAAERTCDDERLHSADIVRPRSVRLGHLRLSGARREGLSGFHGNQ